MLAICLDDCAADLNAGLCAGSSNVDGRMPIPCVPRLPPARDGGWARTLYRWVRPISSSPQAEASAGCFWA